MNIARYQSFQFASKLIRNRIQKSHKVKARHNGLQHFVSEASEFAVENSFTSSYNVHYQIRKQKKPLANVFEELKVYVGEHDQSKGKKKVQEAIQTFYFHCGQDAFQLPPTFRQNVLKYHQMRSLGNKDDENGRSIWRQDSILVSIMRLHLAENDYVSALKLMEDIIRQKQLEQEQRSFSKCGKVHEKVHFRLFGDILAFQARNGYFLQAYQQWQDLKRTLDMQWTNSMQDTLIDLLISCLAFHQVRSNANGTDSFEAQLKCLLQDLRYVTTEITAENARKLHEEAMKVGFKVGVIEEHEISCSNRCPHCKSSLQKEDISVIEWDRLINFIELRKTSKSKREGKQGAVPRLVKHELEPFRDWMLEKHAALQPGRLHYILDGPNLAYLNQNFAQGNFRLDHVDHVASLLADQGHLVTITMPSMYLGSTSLIQVRTQWQKNMRNKKTSNQSHSHTRERTIDDERILANWKEKSWLYGCETATLSDDYYWIYASLILGRLASHQDESLHSIGHHNVRVVTNDRGRDHTLEFKENVTMGMTTWDVAEGSNKISNYLIDRWWNKTVVNIELEYLDRNSKKRKHISPVRSVYLKEPLPYSRVPQMHKTVTGELNFHFPIQSSDVARRAEQPFRMGILPVGHRYLGRMTDAACAAPKVLYCIRHGESMYNEWRKHSLLNFSWIFVRDPMLFDAPLTAKGQQQAQLLSQKIRAQDIHTKVQVIVCSPLTRAIETALEAFKGHNIPILLEPLCREELGTACDVGSSPDELEKAFSHVSESLDFSDLPLLWWLPSSKQTESNGSIELPKTPSDVLSIRECSIELENRIQELITKLMALPQQHIAIVGHSGYFKKMLRMQRKLSNCEMHIVTLDQVIRKNQHG
uniref:Uncharacterized protein AlNc14C104G6164 n=1 Tax=Albugo laibachii Nc14 TaxID=890382 RepID=F0WHV7_9STRA|nr:conserved hypothetical protein [Albugo laibachii Nc14]|eukprot:CCA20832.1 conserved hypothetical protein [Albugo laibachii Nc14]